GQRLRVEASPADAAKLGTSLILLFGLKYERSRLAELFARLMMAINIEDSSAVELFMDMGAVRAVRSLLLELGEERFGPVDPSTRADLEKINDLAKLKALAHRVQSISSWQELLAKHGN